MKILAADTSTMAGSVALLEGETLVAEWTLRSAQTHTRRLLKTIDFLLSEAGWDLKSIDGFAVSSGPGSFTGLRIGMATIKMLAWTGRKLYAAVPSLDALAYPFSFATTPVCPLIDARKGEVYYALYQPDGKGNLSMTKPYSGIPPASLAEHIAGPAIFCGDGWLAFRREIRDSFGPLALEPPPLFHVIRAACIGEIAAKQFATGRPDNPEASIPLYVRPSEAEIRYPDLAKRSSGKPQII
ncbi:MAG: tRNA (adenosine(37)-N6)-threonylcarbamoyltransferase complex dimerization subunit type 1 TsaB [Desulfobacteraceae bacterium]|nr:tRNA (adenosine(37)-N6)-threonylcarbamoyltransferase complex dimerization subunit type 1 TsaB [Desulfobacteraceae bacterium]